MKVQDLYKVLAERTSSTKAEAIKFVRALEGILTEEVRDKGEDIVIGGVGRFVQKVAAPRPGHNPLTGEKVECRGYRSIAFKPAYSFKVFDEAKGKK